MRPLFGIFRARLRMLFQYRAVALAGFGTQLFWGLIRVMVFAAFFRSPGGSQPMSFPEVNAYVWLSQATFALLPWSVDAEVLAMIRSGNVAYELVRPVGLYWQWFFRSLATRVGPTMMRGVPLFLCAWLFFDLPLPADIPTALAWGLVMSGAALLSATITALMGTILLFTTSGEGVNSLIPMLVLLLSGMAIPLPLFPDSIQGVLAFLPFRGLVDAPFRIYLGHLPLATLPGVLSHQLLWACMFTAAGSILTRLGVRRLEIQGG